MDSYFEFSEEFIKEQIINGGLSLNSANQWLSTTQLLFRESRRRGWRTRRLGEGVTGFFDGDELVTVAKGLVTSAVGFNAESVCRSKALSKELFSLAGLPVPRGARFERDALLEAWEFAEGIQGAVVVKPSSGSKGQGVSTDVVTRAQFEGAWAGALRSHSGDLLIEEQVRGLDTRAFVIGDSFIGAVTRIPPFVVGADGLSVAELVKKSLKERSKNAYLKRFGIRVDERILSNQGLNMGTCVDDGRIVFLNGTNNVSQGGYSVDTTDLLSGDFKDLAIQAVRAIPNLNLGGVDIISRSFDVDSAYLIEMNADAAIWLHQYPSYGASRPVAKQILDYLKASKE